MTLFWRWLRAIPVGVWAALGAAVAVLGLFLRGRRLEGELARAKVQAESAKAKAELSGAARHLQRAAEQQHKVMRLEKMRAVVHAQTDKERKRLSTMNPKELDEAYLRMAREKSLPGD